MDELQIKTKKKIEPKEKGAGFYYEITLNNGTEWVCDQNGENWKPAKFEKDLTDEDLMGKFLKKKRLK